MGRQQEKLSEIFGRPVDLVCRWAMEQSQNPYRKHAVLSTAVPIYVDLNIVWRTAQEDLPKLVERIEAYLATQPPLE